MALRNASRRRKKHSTTLDPRARSHIVLTQFYKPRPYPLSRSIHPFHAPRTSLSITPLTGTFVLVRRKALFPFINLRFILIKISRIGQTGNVSLSRSLLQRPLASQTFLSSYVGMLAWYFTATYCKRRRVIDTNLTSWPTFFSLCLFLRLVSDVAFYLQRRNRSRRCRCGWQECRWRAATAWCGRPLRWRCRPLSPRLSSRSWPLAPPSSPPRHPPPPHPLTSYKNIPGREIQVSATGELCSPGTFESQNSWEWSHEKTTTARVIIIVIIPIRSCRMTNMDL